MFNDVEGGEDVLIVGLSKKECEVIDYKACRVIMNKACKMAIERKADEMKHFFVTCASA